MLLIFAYLPRQNQHSGHSLNFIEHDMRRKLLHNSRICIYNIINPLKTKRRLLYLKTQFVLRSKHFSSRL